MLSLFFHSGPVCSYEDALRSDRNAFSKFFSRMLDEGVYLAPSPFESWFVNVAHADTDIADTIDAVRRSFES